MYVIPVDMALFRNRVFVDIISLGWGYWVWYSGKKRRRHTGEDGARDWKDIAANQGMPGTVGLGQKLGEKPGTESHSEPSVGTTPTDALILGLGLQREDIADVQDPQFVMLCYGSPRKLIRLPRPNQHLRNLLSFSQ